MNIACNHGSSEFGYRNHRHSVEYNEVIAKERGIEVSFRRYPNNTVIQYHNTRNSRKHKITSKMENCLFGENDVLEIFSLLGVETAFSDRIEIVSLLKSGSIPHKTYYKF